MRGSADWVRRWGRDSLRVRQVRAERSKVKQGSKYTCFSLYKVGSDVLDSENYS